MIISLLNAIDQHDQPLRPLLDLINLNLLLDIVHDVKRYEQRKHFTTLRKVHDSFVYPIQRNL